MVKLDIKQAQSFASPHNCEQQKDNKRHMQQELYYQGTKQRG